MHHDIKKLVDLALAEDVGEGDITTLATVHETSHAVGRITAKQPLIVAGLEAARQVFATVDPHVSWETEREDGFRCKSGDVLAMVKGKTRSLLVAERTALNFLQRLSGIATLTRQFVDAVEGTKTMIMDTRKTTPGYRALEKHAVRMGGGTSHRMGLYDQFLIKNNHIAAAGSISAALKQAHKEQRKSQLIEVEVRKLDEVKEALKGSAQIIMLDNMSVDQVTEAVKLVKGQAKLEVSGNINLENVRKYAATGVDFISVGAITHSAPAADIHMPITVE